MTSDGRSETNVAPEIREAAKRPPADPPLYSEAAPPEGAKEAGGKKGDRRGNTKAEAEELMAEEIAESQDSAT
jgi:hypothetical protein